MLSLWRRTRPWVRMVAVVLLVGVVGSGVYWFGLRETSAQAAAPAEQTQAVAASLTTIEQSVTASGTLTPTVQADVAFAVSGTVTSVDVAVGDTVTAGQQLATVDTLQLDAALLQARAELVSAQASLSNAQDEADGTTSSTAQIAALTAQVAVAQAAADDAEADMAAATLISPVAGLLTTVDLEVGDAVTGSGSAGSSGSSGSSATGGTSGAGVSGGTGSTSSSATSSAQFVVIGTDAWQVGVTVDESDVALIAVGDQVEMTTDGSTETVYGTVSEIGLLSSSTGGVAAYPVVIDVTGSPEHLHDGESVSASIIYERRTDVLTVPSAAVTTEDGESVVTQEGADGEQVTTVVTVGATSGNLVEITDGLAEGDEVLVRTFSPRASGTEDGSDGTGGQSGQVPDVGSGEMPDFSQMPGGGQLPGGGQGGSNG